MRILKEEQRFTQTWLIILIVVSIIVPIIMIIYEYSKEDTSMSTTEFVLIISFILIIIVPFFFFKLITRIDEKGIHYKYFPFHRSYRTILWTEIKTANIRKYDAISEYGGWGIKGGFRRKKGKAISISGNLGIQLELINSKKILIGVKKKSDAKKALNTYRHKIVHHEN